MALDVIVKIDLVKAPGKVGMGIPLILAQNAEADVAFTEVTSLTEVTDAGYANTSDTYKAANLIFMQNDAPRSIAVCSTTGTAAEWLGDEGNVSKDWRQLIVVGGVADHAAIMPVIETLRGKMYFASLSVEDTATLKVDAMERTVLFYCTDVDYAGVEVAALVGASAGLDAGSFTYKNLILKGIAAQQLSDGEINAIHEKGGITFVRKAGDNVTSEGKVAGGEYIDIIDTKDYIIQQLEYRTQKFLNVSAKVPYDNNGIGQLELIAVSVLKEAANMGMIAEGEDGSPAYTVNYALRADTLDSDRAVRRYIGGNFSFNLAGAVHNVEITGQIIV